VLWANIAPTLTSVIKSNALAAPDTNWLAQPDIAFWDGGKTPFTSPVVKATLKLRIPASRAIFDQRRVIPNPSPSAGAELLEVQHGMREFTLNVLCKSYSQEFPKWAHEMAERIRTRIQRRSVRQELLAVQVVLVEAGPINDVRLVEDDRATSVASLDLRMRAAFEDEAQAITWIEFIELTGQIKDTAGVTYPAPPNLSEAVMPSD
jgi:hypothetical protein